MPRHTSNELACPCELSNSPCLHLTAESDSAEFTSTPDGSNARTTLQIRQIRIWRVTGTSCAARHPKGHREQAGSLPPPASNGWVVAHTNWGCATTTPTQPPT